MFSSLIFVDVAALCVGLEVCRRTSSLGVHGNATESAIRIIRILSGLALILGPGFLIAGAMGLARAGPKGPFFFIEQAFYTSTMGYPVMYLVCTGVSVLLANRNRLVLALLAQAAPIAIPIVLVVLMLVLG
ncbi:MAG: hypothetical protein ACJ8FY_13565 [Gemmataceae bacterium]